MAIKGHKQTEEHKKKLSNSHKGKKMSDKAKEKMVATRRENNSFGKNKGKKIPKLIGNTHGFKKGSSPWNKGKEFVIMKGNKNGFKKGQIPWNKGVKGFVAKEKHYNWKGGITLIYSQIRQCFEYRQWRSDVFSRDNYSCTLCGENKGGNLNAHHIKPFSKILEFYNIKTLEEAIACEELWNINNGVTLCDKCHRKTHQIKRKTSTVCQ